MLTKKKVVTKKLAGVVHKDATAMLRADHNNQCSRPAARRECSSSLGENLT